MKKLGGAILLALVIFFLSAVAVLGQQGPGPGRDPQYEQQIYERLAKINPAAVQVFKDATAAADAEQLTTAKTGFLKVLELAPGFPDALRRLSSVEREQADYKNAEAHARQAVAAQASFENKAALAAALTGFADQAKLKESLTLAKEAQQAFPEDPYYNEVLLLASYKNQDIPTLRTASQQLIKILPEYATGHLFAGFVAIQDNDPERAESELLLAQQYGIPKADIDKLLSDSNVRTQAATNRALRAGGYGLAGWLVGLVLLFIVGALLSSLTLSAVSRQIASGQSEIGPGEKLIRQLYRMIIGITALYFYISIPILILLVLAAVGGMIYLFFAIGRIPIQLAVFILTAGLVTLYAIVRSVFARLQAGDPGRKVEAAEMPELWQFSREVAAKVGTRPADAIFLTPGVEVAVTERGGLVSKLRDKGERILIIGLGALSALSQGQLRAVLAHEYGHFSHRDTSGGTVARQVQYSVNMMAANLIANGLSRWYNPVWWFINGYYRIFLRITLGASRLQEILADRIATLSYGIQNFSTGLTTIIRADLEFDFKINSEVAAAINARRGLNNIYALPELEDATPLEQKLSEVMARPSSPYDSHPAPRERLALIKRIQTAGFFDEDPRPACELLPNASQLQAEVTAEVEERLRAQNIL